MKLTREVIRDVIQHIITELKMERLSPVSVDDQIDSILVGYENDSLIEELKVESILIGEQAEEAEETEETEETEDEKDEKEIEGSEAVDTEEAAETLKPKLNLNEFANRVARLVTAYDNLLDIKTVILTRAKNYITENYDENTGNDLQELLETEYQLLPTSEEPPSPPINYAAGAEAPVAGA